MKTIIVVAEFHHIRTHCRGPLRAAEVADGRFRGVSFPRRIRWISKHCVKLVVGQLLKKMPPFFFGIRLYISVFTKAICSLHLSISNTF